MRGDLAGASVAMPTLYPDPTRPRRFRWASDETTRAAPPGSGSPPPGDVRSTASWESRPVALRTRRIGLGMALVMAVALAAGAVNAGAATRCPAAFTVLHTDRVGSVSIPQDTYFLQPTGLSCSTASTLLGRFLDDFDGALPDGWTTAATGRGFVNVAAG